MRDHAAIIRNMEKNTPGPGTTSRCPSGCYHPQKAKDDQPIRRRRKITTVVKPTASKPHVAGSGMTETLSMRLAPRSWFAMMKA